MSRPRSASSTCRARYGVAAEVRIVNLPGLGEGEDVTDWIAKGRDPDELVALCHDAPRYEPAPDTKGDDADPRRENRSTPDWIDGCIKSEHGTPLSIFANAMEGMRSDPLLCEAVAYDEMLRAPILVNALPAATAMEHKPRPIKDADVAAARNSCS